MKEFTPKFTITNTITEALTRIERARGFLEAATLSEDWVARMNRRALLYQDLPASGFLQKYPRHWPQRLLGRYLIQAEYQIHLLVYLAAMERGSFHQLSKFFQCLLVKDCFLREPFLSS